jgi:hypothetical protein
MLFLVKVMNLFRIYWVIVRALVLKVKKMDVIEICNLCKIYRFLGKGLIIYGLIIVRLLKYLSLRVMIFDRNDFSGLVRLFNA